jgi:hypothetical protein
MGWRWYYDGDALLKIYASGKDKFNGGEASLGGNYYPGTKSFGPGRY